MLNVKMYNNAFDYVVLATKHNTKVPPLNVLWIHLVKQATTQKKSELQLNGKET